MTPVSRKIHAFVLCAAIAVAALAFASNSVFAQAVTLLYEDRATDAKTGEIFEAGPGPFEVRWSATGGKFLVKILDANDLELISSAPQSRDGDDAGPMTGNMPFEGPGQFRAVVDASGPWHVRIIQQGR